MTPRKIAYTALFLALAILLPYTFHMFGIMGRIFLPMHIPVLLCGFLVGAFPAVIVGLAAPLLSHLMTSMPPAYAVPLMSLELPMYGLVTGLTYRYMKMNIYLSLIIAMIVGRIAFAAGLIVLGRFMELPYGPLEFFAGGVVLSGWPGIILQIIVIPPIVAALRKSMATAPQLQ